MPPLEKATLTNANTGRAVRVLFNPEEYTLAKDVNYAQSTIPGLSGPITQFVAGNMQTLEMQLLLDTLEAHDGSPVGAGGDVRELCRQVTALMEIDPETHAPPIVVFAWGTLTFTCVLARVSQQFTMFAPTGVPVRARLQVTFNEYLNAELEAKEISRQTADVSKRHVVGVGDTLSLIAWRAYGDPRAWRPIAIHNDIDDPEMLEVGRGLAVPPLPYRDPLSGRVYE